MRNSGGRGRWVRCRRVVVLREKDSPILVTNASFEAEAGTRANIATCCSRFKAYTSDTRFRCFLFSIIILFVWKHARRWREVEPRLELSLSSPNTPWIALSLPFSLLRLRCMDPGTTLVRPSNPGHYRNRHCHHQNVQPRSLSRYRRERAFAEP